METKKLKLTIPDYLSIGDYKKLTNLEHLGALQKKATIISLLTNVPVEEVLTWDLDSITKVSNDLEKLLDAPNEYYPIFEHEGVLYGYSSVSKMTGAEFIDIENLTKDPNNNLSQIMALLYRPIVKHSLGSINYNVKNVIKTAKGLKENVYKYYTLEPYNSEEREIRAEVFNSLPSQYAMGTLGFFLCSEMLYLNSIKGYSEELKPIMEETVMTILESIGDGSQHSTNLVKLGSLTLAVTNQSLTAISSSYSTS
jgi:hypothetical protein